ncbi:37s ribosomal protein [Lasiodiplodia theobromae]|uniref:37s ribosomal protein n=1 Tax=Lasiodiplodia theobromae TaxID=45133 RepID=UPI0015C3E77D|nr:37s ribosomal protein [Lasiodiplodia theobromae]KAF4540067.1 37s ribosomal protein [Lasiodiplodia theobromae]
MATTVWPPIPTDELAREEDAALARELEWLLSSLRTTLKSLKAGLEECAALLAPTEHGSTLVVSTVRSESLKGFVTRVGTRIVKGDIKLRLPSLPPPRGATSYPLTISQQPQASTLVIEQLTAARTHINSCLDVVDVTTWAGDAKNANYISGQLQLLYDNIEDARQALKGSSEVRPQWWDHPADEKIFDPPLPPEVSVHLYLQDAAIILEIRTLEPWTGDDGSIFGIRKAIAGALGVSHAPAHDEAEKVFTYRKQEVKVKEKIRVETQDPNLISAMAKLNALEHNVALSRKALDIVMGKSDDDGSLDA